MIYELYSMRDDMVGFMTPVVELSRDTALRNFKIAAFNMPKLQRPDISLYYLGMYDTELGEIKTFFDGEKLPEFIARASDFKDGE